MPPPSCGKCVFFTIYVLHKHVKTKAFADHVSMVGACRCRWIKLSGQDVKSSGAASRYATALFELAQDANKVDGVEQEMIALKKVLGANDELSLTLSSSVVSASDKAAAVVGVASKSGFSALTCNFVGMAAGAGRAGELGHMADCYQDMCAIERGALKAEAVSAQALSAKQEKDLAATLKKALGQDVKIETQVDPALLGGLVVKVGSRMFDSSLKSKLEGLNLAMKES